MGLRDGEPQPPSDPGEPEGAVPEPHRAPLPGGDPVLCAHTSQPAQLPGDDLGLDPRVRERSLHGEVPGADDRAPAGGSRAWMAGLLRGAAAPRLRGRRSRASWRLAGMDGRATSRGCRTAATWATIAVSTSATTTPSSTSRA